jgi:hypothetical protein
MSRSCLKLSLLGGLSNIDFCITGCKTAFMSKGILIPVAYICELLICCDQPATTKALELGSSTGMNYVYFVLIHTIVVVYTAWC